MAKGLDFDLRVHGTLLIVIVVVLIFAAKHWLGSHLTLFTDGDPRHRNRY